MYVKKKQKHISMIYSSEQQPKGDNDEEIDYLIDKEIDNMLNDSVELPIHLGVCTTNETSLFVSLYYWSVHTANNGWCPVVQRVYASGSEFHP